MSLALGKRGVTILSGVALWISSAAVGSLAQPSSGTTVRATSPHGSVLAGNHRLPGQKSAPPHPREAAPQSARIVLKDGKLTVSANNSDLAQILKDISDKSGMTIQGLGSGPRIFGVYGPGESREVLRSLLAGSGYNFILVGGANDGVPRELMLAPMTAAVPNEALREAGRNEPQQPKQEQTDQGEPGPGAIYPVPPPATPDDDTRVEQNMQRLQHLEQRRNDPQ
jgi:hypothetical protein